jgi:uncharacterized protein (TIGR00369 family)
MSEPAASPVTRTRTYDYTLADFDVAAAMNMSGLDYMRALTSGALGAKPPIADTLGMSVPVVEEGRAWFEADPEDFLLNPLGTVHGGFAATMLDSAMAVAVHTALPAATGYSTAELKINYTRAITPRSGRLRAEGSVIHVGRQMATAEGRLVGVDDGRLYAHGSTTCFLFPLAGAAKGG